MFEQAWHPNEIALAAPLRPDPADTTQAAVSHRSALADVDTLYAAERPRIFRFFLFSLRDADAADSLTQDTFVKAWRTEASYRGDCAPATWLMRIAMNLLRDHTRRGAYQFWKRAAQHSIDADLLAGVLRARGASAETALIARDEVVRMWRAVEGLSHRQRSIFLLRYVEDLPLTEIAEVTGLPTATVKTHLYRALERVRQVMKEGNA